LETIKTCWRNSRIKGILEKSPGVAAVELEAPEPEGRTPQLQITLNMTFCNDNGLQAAEVNKAVTAALAGQKVGINCGRRKMARHYFSNAQRIASG
jgi:Cu/Ag efflux pump CusA